ncbi:MAG: bifunctional enzyme IspD/IspF [Micavibrio sp.]|nr:MAG: bifunctional enzyme IspD/IspF [Micavibrio sp.]
MEELDQIRVIIDPEHAELYQEAVKGLDLPDFVAGGMERKDSIYNGLKSFSNLKNENIILIHDGARPLVQENDIRTVAEALTNHEAVSLATSVADTLKYGHTAEPVERNGLYALQTPQGFHYGTIKKAHEQAGPDGHYTDDTGLVSALGIAVKLVPGHKSNFKITTEDDWEMAEKLLQQDETRTGMGFDVHAFADEAGSNGVRLCGVSIPHDKPLMGHSDADVGLHALTDAILGSISAGDIGQHFPPSNDNYKDMDSAIFLGKAIELLAAKGGSVLNLDITLICEEPKIGSHREAMEQRIAEIAEIDPGRVSVKATTSEKLGFTGRGEGIAAQAIATVRLPRE